jgi:hypothetical protein
LSSLSTFALAFSSVFCTLTWPTSLPSQQVVPFSHEALHDCVIVAVSKFWLWSLSDLVAPDQGLLLPSVLGSLSSKLWD